MPGLAVKTNNRDGFSCLSKWDDMMHNCATCSHKDRDKNFEPCVDCGLDRVKWERKEDKKC